MFGNGRSQSGIRNFFGPKGNMSTVLGSGSGVFTVMGSEDHDGVYFQNGNIISGPDGIHTVIGNGPVKTVFGPNGETHTILENDFGGTIL